MRARWSPTVGRAGWQFTPAGELRGDVRRASRRRPEADLRRDR
jgi:hypothetical protein